MALLRVISFPSYLAAGKWMVFPDAAERRAASRISVTVTFVSSDDSASCFRAIQNDRPQIGQRIVVGGRDGLAASCSSVVCRCGARGCRLASPYRVSRLAVDFHVFAVEGPVPRGLNDGLRLRISQNDGRLVVHVRIDFWFDLLGTAVTVCGRWPSISQVMRSAP